MRIEFVIDSSLPNRTVRCSPDVYERIQQQFQTLTASAPLACWLLDGDYLYGPEKRLAVNPAVLSNDRAVYH